MIDKLLGETMKVLAFKYDDKAFVFRIECVLPGSVGSALHVFNKQNFPNHKPMSFLDEKVQVGEQVHVWIKEEELLKKEGWKDITKHTLASDDSPFKIGKGKKVYLGGAHTGVVHLDSHFKPFILIKNYRFSPSEIKCILKADNLFQGKDAQLTGFNGTYIYDSKQQVLAMPGKTFKIDEINSLIDVMRRARLI